MESNKDEMIAELSKHNDSEKERLLGEISRVKESIQIIKVDVETSLSEKEQRIKEEMAHKYNSFQSVRIFLIFIQNFILIFCKGYKNNVERDYGIRT